MIWVFTVFYRGRCLFICLILRDGALNMFVSIVNDVLWIMKMSDEVCVCVIYV